MISRKYLYLVALAREKHFGHAAVSCCISPSTLSIAIRDLERELGLSLVERSKQFTCLTREGEAVVAHTQEMLAASERLKQSLFESCTKLSGRLKLGVIPTALTVCAPLNAMFIQKHPGILIEVLSLSTDIILNKLHHFEIDAGIVYTESVESSTNLSILPLWHEQHVLLTGDPSLFADRSYVTWQEIAEIPLCLLTQDMQNRKVIDKVFSSVKQDPKPSLETNSITSTLAHVSSGQWSSILPKAVIDSIGIPGKIRLLELKEPTVDWSTGLVTLSRTPHSPIVEELIRSANEFAQIYKKSAPKTTKKT